MAASALVGSWQETWQKSSGSPPAPLGPIDKDAKVIEKNEASEFLSIGELWQRIVGKNELWREIEEGGAPVEVTIDAVDVLHEQFTLLHDGGRFPIRSIEFDAILQAKVPQMPLAEAAVYSSADGKEVFARLGTWKGSEKDVVKGLTFIGYVKKTERQS